MTSIGNSAFHGCSSLTSITIPNSVTSIGFDAFPKNVKLYVKRGTHALLALWQASFVPYELGTTNILNPPSVSIVSTTQTTITCEIKNASYPEFDYIRDVNGELCLVDVTLSSNNFVVKNLSPDIQLNIGVRVSLKGETAPYYRPSVKGKTQSISPTVVLVNKTASSFTAKGSYIKGDAIVGTEKFKVDNKIIESDGINFTGLSPKTSYKIVYIITVKYGENNQYTKSYEASQTITTDELKMITQQPKVISVGNVIVAAETNLDDEETNVGFEWRRTDWTDEFASNTGNAYLYEGEMEGYIRNLYAEKLWKYRPYYESASGQRYYGEWVGIDPTNTSYFEPTVHTYDKVVVDGNIAQIKGYAQRGTDSVTKQGFKYWPIDKEAKARGAAHLEEEDIPEDAMTVTAKGQVMTTTLKNLRYSTVYCYVAFVETSENETFYGEMQTFTTGNAAGDMDGDGHITVDDITILIAVYLGETTNGNADVDGDGQVTVGDITNLIELYLQTK